MASQDSLENLDHSARDELAALAKDLAENPKTRREMLRLTREVRPQLPIPELDVDDRMAKSQEAVNKELETLRAERARDRAEQSLEKRRDKLRERGLTAKDIEGVEKIMLEKKIPEHETAAEYWEWMNQAAQPTPTGYNPSPVKQFDLKNFYKNPTDAARQEAFKALHELRKPARPIGL